MYYDLRDARLPKPSLFNAIVAPRPIAWVSSLSAAGVPNLAPFSYFNLLTNSPPTLVFSCVNATDREEKDTLANIRASGEFVVNLVSRPLLEKMHLTSTPVPHGTSEFDLASLESVPCEHVAPPRVRGAPAAFECRLLQLLPVAPVLPEDLGCTAIVGRIVGLHLEPHLLNAEGRFDSVEAGLMARLGGNFYSGIGPVVEMAPLARAG